MALTIDDLSCIYDVVKVAAGIFLHRSHAPDAMDFGNITTIVNPGTSTDDTHIDLSPTAEIWAHWQQYEGDPAEGRIVYAPGSSGYATEEIVANAPGTLAMLPPTSCIAATWTTFTRCGRSRPLQAA